MDDSQDSTISIGQTIKDRVEANHEELKINQQVLVNEFEREIQCLERDIRQQKESSVNAKTAITFEQLKKIYNLSLLMGSQKEYFFDRICRAAEIQRASLKNRLKQNKDRFEIHSQSIYSQNDSQNSTQDSQTFLLTQNTFQSLFNNTLQGKSESLHSSILEEENLRLPAERQFDLLQLGFSYADIKQFSDLFEKFKNDLNSNSPSTSFSLPTILSQFSNYISINPPLHLKLVCIAFNLLELGNSLKEIKRVLRKAINRFDLESNDDEPISNYKKMCIERIEGSFSPSANDEHLRLEKSSSPPSDDGAQKV